MFCILLLSLLLYCVLSLSCCLTVSPSPLSGVFVCLFCLFLSLSVYSVFIFCAMSDLEMDRLLNEMSDLVDQAEHQAHLQQLISMHQEAEPSTGQPSTSNPSTSRPSKSKQDVRWIKRDSDGNIIYGRPRSSRKQAGTIFFTLMLNKM